MSTLPEITSFIVSINEIIGKLHSFLTDSIILKMDFSIHAIGNELEGLTGFSTDELSGQSLSKICLDHHLREQIATELSRGYFVDLPTNFLTKRGEPVEVSISGFYLGLISEINGYIVLKIKLLENNSFLKRELVTKKSELDSFIYRAAHDLRGPLATIKGLVNLLKMREGNIDVDELTTLIDVHANKLDDKLFKLLYIADDSSKTESFNGYINFESLKSILEKTLHDNFDLDKAVFRFNPLPQNLHGVNERRVARLLNNILLYIIGLPIASITKGDGMFISVDFAVLCNKLNVTIRTEGFLASEKIRNAICEHTSLYTDILIYPFLFNYYVAQKEAMQLNALLRIDFASESEQVLYLSIPLSASLVPPAKNAKTERKKTILNKTH